MSERAPAEVYALADHLCDEMVVRDWTTTDVALRMGGNSARDFAIDLLSLDLLMCVQEDGCLVGDELFDKLAVVFEVSPDYFRNLDDAWRKWPDKRVAFEPPQSIFGPASRRQDA